MTLSANGDKPSRDRKPRSRGVSFCLALAHHVHAGAVLLLFGATLASAASTGDAQRGLYVAKVAGCVGCHTEAVEKAVQFAGGRALKTPFGTFYGPNITPHAEAGIGSWTEADFFRAMRRGGRPNGSSYFPAFPYPSFTGMTDEDLRDLWAYLKTLPASDHRSQAHDLRFPYSFRPLVTAWKWMFFTSGPLAADPQLNAVQNRGRYLVQALGHCGECHTPRNALGAPRRDRALAGGKGPEDKKIPNLTPTRLKFWTDADLKRFLTTGDTPDGDVASETMAEVIRNSTSRLTPQDLDAMVAYLRTLPPLPEEAQKK
ncbi:MAG: c-type cytochrome [Burkholderiales bacterium]